MATRNQVYFCVSMICPCIVLAALVNRLTLKYNCKVKQNLTYLSPVGKKAVQITKLKPTIILEAHGLCM